MGKSGRSRKKEKQLYIILIIEVESGLTDSFLKQLSHGRRKKEIC